MKSSKASVEMQTALVLIIALALDRLLGEPKRFHPLAGFGALAARVEKGFNKTGRAQRLRGFSALTLMLVPPLVLAGLLIKNIPFSFVLETALLTFAIGARSLEEHALQVKTALNENDLASARRSTSYLVSRDTDAMNEEQLAGATIESTLENGNDAVFAALFWFLVGGAAMALVYRLANTLDAMWGYRTKRFARFGWAAARLDDVLNYVPARLTAFTYALTGQFTTALHCWRAQGRIWKSINAGPVMAAGAGALDLRLGGPAPYHGEMQHRPPLGTGRAPKSGDIKRAVSLLKRGIILWGALALLIAGGLTLA